MLKDFNQVKWDIKLSLQEKSLWLQCGEAPFQCIFKDKTGGRETNLGS